MTRKTSLNESLAHPEGEWLRLSSKLTRVIQMLSSRDDLIVNIAPKAGLGSPAAMLPTVANIEINADFWPENVDPASAWPGDKRDWERYPTVMGLLSHEASHADHSQWSWELKDQHNKKKRELTDDEQRALGAAELLEESRIEAIHMRERPQDAPWLEASATSIALAEALKAMGEEEIPKAGAARAAALILARETAGSIQDSDELDKVREAVIRILGTNPDGQDTTTTIRRRGERMLNKLEDLWTEFQGTPDDASPETFLGLGRQWFELTKDDGGQDGDDGDEPGQPGAGGDGGEGEGKPGKGELAKALRDALNDLADAAQGQASGTEARTKLMKKLAEAANQRKNEAAKKDEAKKRAKDVFHGQQASRGMGMFAVLQGYRPPTVDERKRAHRTYRDILKAYYRAKAVTMITSQMPPGRLNARKAMTGQAQRAMGMQPTVEPFSRKDRRSTPNPPLKVAIIQDSSGSQDSPAAAAASGAWSLAMGVRSIPDGHVAMVTFGDRVQPILWPNKKPEGVPIINARGGTSFLPAALQAAEGELNLMKRGAARLIVIITDGFLFDDDMYVRDATLKRYLDAGIKILWVVTGDEYSYRQGGNMMDVSSRTLVVPEIKHPNFQVARPYQDHNKIAEMITSEAVKTLAETKV